MVVVFFARDGFDEKARSKSLFSLVLSSCICVSCADAVRSTGASLLYLPVRGIGVDCSTIPLNIWAVKITCAWDLLLSLASHGFLE